MNENRTVHAAGTSFQLTGSFNVFSPSDNSLYWGWPYPGLSWFSVPLMMFEPVQNMMITDFQIIKNCNGVSGSLEPSVFSLVGRPKADGIDYTTRPITQTSLLHENVIFSNLYPSQIKNNLMVPMLKGMLYAYQWLTPTWAPNPTNVYVNYISVRGFYQ